MLPLTKQASSECAVETCERTLLTVHQHVTKTALPQSPGHSLSWTVREAARAATTSTRTVSSSVKAVVKPAVLTSTAPVKAGGPVS